MSTTTLDARFAGAAQTHGQTDAKVPGIFARIVARMVAGQELRARRHVNAYLATMTDAEIADLGFADRLDEIRRTHPDPRAYWA
jgi:hypothetical protein